MRFKNIQNNDEDDDSVLMDIYEKSITPGWEFFNLNYL